MAHTFKLGSVAISKAGRDSGKYFVVVNTEGEDYVYLADGAFGAFQSLKRKKRSISYKRPMSLRVSEINLRKGKRYLTLKSGARSKTLRKRAPESKRRRQFCPKAM